MGIDHLSKPRIRERRFDDWHAELRAAAACPNLFCKISGIVTEADWRSWTKFDLWPYVDAAVNCFGPERLMFGSDWPVCELAATYAEWYSAAVDLASELTKTERDQIFGGTARRFYRLP
jgi:L-fuconolactonase